MRYLIILLALLFHGCTKEVKHNESYYQNKLCEKLDGISEFGLEDRTRVDCLTSKYAIEVDWARKWAEGVGQSLYYSHMTTKKPAIALIVSKKDDRYLKRLQILADKYNIKIFIIQKEN